MWLLGVFICEYLMMIAVAGKRNPCEMFVHSWGHRWPDSLPYWPHPQKVKAVMMGKSVLRCASAWLLISDASEAETRGNQRGRGWLLVGWGSCLQACIKWSGPYRYHGRHCLLGLRWMTSTPGSLRINFQSQNFEGLEGTLRLRRMLRD